MDTKPETNGDHISHTMPGPNLAINTRYSVSRFFATKLESAPFEFPVRGFSLRKRCADDIVTVISPPVRINQLLNEFSSVQRNLKFPIGVESDNQVAFLDLVPGTRQEGDHYTEKQHRLENK